jgi:hypothetical protein
VALKDKYVVRLTAAPRDELERLTATGQRSAAMVTRARILLKANADGDAWTDDRSAEALDTSGGTVARIRKQFVQQGLKLAVQRKRPTGRPYRKLDGAQEARLAALACSPPPEGQARWTRKLLADRLVELEVVEAIDPATAWRTLTKTRPSRGASSRGCCHPRPTRASSRPWRTSSRSTPGPMTPSGRRSASTKGASS